MIPALTSILLQFEINFTENTETMVLFFGYFRFSDCLLYLFVFVCSLLFVYFLFACFFVRNLKHYKPAHSFLWSEFIW